MQLIDIGANLTHPAFHGDLPEVLVRATVPADPALLPLAAAPTTDTAAPSLRSIQSIPLGALATLSASARPPAPLIRQDDGGEGRAWIGPAAPVVGRVRRVGRIIRPWQD